MNSLLTVGMAARLAVRMFRNECYRAGARPQLPCQSRTVLSSGARSGKIDDFATTVIAPAIINAAKHPTWDVPAAPEVTVDFRGITVRATGGGEFDQGEWLDLHFSYTPPNT
jgi:hypothetical protein